MYKTRAKRVYAPYWVLLMHINNHVAWPNDGSGKDNINMTIRIQTMLTVAAMLEHIQAAFTPHPALQQKHVTPSFSQSPQRLSCSTFSPAWLFRCCSPHHTMAANHISHLWNMNALPRTSQPLDTTGTAMLTETSLAVQLCRVCSQHWILFLHSLRPPHSSWSDWCECLLTRHTRRTASYNIKIHFTCPGREPKDAVGKVNVSDITGSIVWHQVVWFAVFMLDRSKTWLTAAAWAWLHQKHNQAKLGAINYCHLLSWKRCNVVQFWSRCHLAVAAATAYKHTVASCFCHN